MVSHHDLYCLGCNQQRLQPLSEGGDSKNIIRLTGTPEKGRHGPEHWTRYTITGDQYRKEWVWRETFAEPIVSAAKAVLVRGECYG